MKTLKFKTNINCMGCVQTVTPFLSGETKIAHWKVDINDPGKILTVQTNLEKEEVRKLIKEAGFRAESLE